MDDKIFYKKVLLDGCNIEYKQLSVCDLRNCTGTYSKGYQVYCDSYKVKHDAIYKNVDEAVKEFLELKRRLK